MRPLVYAFVFVFMSVSTSLAGYDQSKDWFYSLTWNERVRIQFLLVFTGDYAATVDGAFGRHTYKALTSFQKNREFPADGVPDSEELKILHRDGFDLVRRVGFETRNDAAAGVTLGIPVKLFDPPTNTRHGRRWRAYDGSIELETLQVPGQETSYEDLYKRLTKTWDTRVIDYKNRRNDFFVVSGQTDGRDFYLRIMKTPDGSRGFSLSWEPKHAVFMDRVAVAMSNSLKYFDGGTAGRMDAITSAPDVNKLRPEIPARPEKKADLEGAG